MKLQSCHTLKHDTDSAYYASCACHMGFSFIVRIVVLSFIEISAMLDFHFIEPNRENSARLLHEKRFGHQRDWY